MSESLEIITQLLKAFLWRRSAFILFYSAVTTDMANIMETSPCKNDLTILKLL